jgi:hypothetical protein
MAGPYAITTPVQGQPIPSAGFGIAVKNAINDLDARTSSLETGTQPLVRLIQQSAQSFTTGVVAALTFGASSEDIDTDNYHDTVTNNSRVTPLRAGYYEVNVTMSLAAGASSYVQIVAAVAKNGTRVDPQAIMRPDPTTAATSAFTSAMVSCNGSTDYIEAYGQQTSSGSQNTNTSTGFRCVLEVKYLRAL